MRNIRALLSLAALLAGCTVGPDYHPPDAAMPTRFEGAAPGGSSDVARWWRSFDDPELVRWQEVCRRCGKSRPVYNHSTKESVK